MWRKSTEVAAEMESVRATLLELDAIEDPTEEQVEQARSGLDSFTTLEAELTAATAREEKLERVRSFALAHPEVREKGSAPDAIVRNKRDLWDGLDRAGGGEIRSRAREVVEEQRYEGIYIPDESRERALQLVERIPGAAELIMATSSPDYMSAFQTFMRSQGQPVYSPAEAVAVRASLSLVSGTGGYVLPFLLDPTLIPTGSIGRNPIRAISRVETGTQNVWHGVTASNVTTYWKPEAAAFTDGSPTFGGPAVTAANLTAYVTGSYEIFEDSNLLSQLPGLIGEAFNDAETQAFLVGSGSNAPRGVITAISGTAGSTITATTRGTFTSASTADVFNLLNSIPPRYEDNVTWVGNKMSFNTIRQMVVGTAGVPVVDMMEKNALLGSPWVSASAVTNSATSGNVLVVLGDFGRFLIYDRLGTVLEVISNVVDTNGLPTGQRGLVAHKRVGSDVLDVNAFRFLKA